MTTTLDLPKVTIEVTTSLSTRIWVRGHNNFTTGIYFQFTCMTEIGTFMQLSTPFQGYVKDVPPSIEPSSP
jgi:hypothetical protein